MVLHLSKLNLYDFRQRSILHKDLRRILSSAEEDNTGALNLTEGNTTINAISGSRRSDSSTSDQDSDISLSSRDDLEDNGALNERTTSPKKHEEEQKTPQLVQQNKILRSTDSQTHKAGCCKRLLTCQWCRKQDKKKVREHDYLAETPTPHLLEIKTHKSPTKEQHQREEEKQKQEQESERFSEILATPPRDADSSFLSNDNYLKNIIIHNSGQPSIKPNVTFPVATRTAPPNRQAEQAEVEAKQEEEEALYINKARTTSLGLASRKSPGKTNLSSPFGNVFHSELNRNVQVED